MEHDDSGTSREGTGNASAGNNERIGDMLRREREKRQISVETIAAKLRLNAKYIEALEENRYDRLPGDTYIRVYLRSLARYLSLDSEEIFRRFFDERGVTGADTLRKDSATKINLPALEERKENGSKALIVMALIIALACFGFVARKHGWHFSHSSKSSVAASLNRSAASQPPAGAVAAGSTGSAVAFAGESSAVASETTRTAVVSAPDSLRPPAAADSGPMKLLISVQRDSCRVRVFSDGRECRRVLHRGGWKTFFAQDSFNVFVSASDVAALTLDEKPVSLPAKTGASAIRVGRAGIAWWTLEKWDTTFH